MSISSVEAPEIEIEIEFEDYNDVTNRVTYQIEIESSVVPPTNTAVCQCGISFGSELVQAPESFRVLNAIVGLRRGEGDDFDLDSFSGFEPDDDVAATLAGLNGTNNGSTTFGFSTPVNPFNLPPLQAEDAFVLGFLIEFAPEDFAAVNGNQIQFAAGSNEPGHPINLFQRYQPTLKLPPFRLDECDLNYDLVCDVQDLDVLYSLGDLARGFERTDATEVYDLNGDDRIDRRDVQEWLKKAADFHGLDDAYAPGDVNLDGEFGTSDLIQVFVAGQYESGNDGQTWATGDWNADGYFDSSDTLYAFQVGRFNPSANIQPLPEPNTAPFTLLLVTLCGWTAIRHRK
ncbi:MAG: hypothetical protein KDA87_21580 [Planctomycetales bacterium]|nr:hypothetical protein [Planctomycetales bacterium]